MIYYIQRRNATFACGWLTLDGEGEFASLVAAKEHVQALFAAGEARTIRVIGVSEIHHPPTTEWAKEQI